MDKKVLYGYVDELVESVKTENGLDVLEARALVGIALRRNKEVLAKVAMNPALVLTVPAVV